ncbi:MAG TPA: sugar transferase [Longimicrobiaceae bacterium]|nr:sugar transferase [Longimicrobiaceae bacterium]
MLIPAQKSGPLSAPRVLTSSAVTIEDLVDRAPSPGPWTRIVALTDAPQIGRRALNVVFALVGLLLAAPLMLVIAVLVKLSSPGPIIFRQTRVGVDRRRHDGSQHHWRRRVDYGGRLFTMYKFRTMTTAGDSAVQVWAQPSDPRVTRLGAVLRKYRLDELPQLLNVLKGDMNIVGPRPEQPKIFAELREKIDHYSERQRVLPGITGWAQINQSYDRCLSDVRNKLSYDLEYIERQSVAQDLRILLRTVPVVVFKRGAW